MDKSEDNVVEPTSSKENIVEVIRHPSQPSVVSKSREPKKQPKKFALKPIVALVVIILLIVGGYMLCQRNGQQDSGSSTVNKTEYQAVFLSNGQVYFGKLQTVNQSYLKLTDIYYLQLQQAVQPAGTASSTGGTAANPTTTTTSSAANSSSNVQLIKLGNEIHGPEDEMTINRSQVLFWENLKPSGKVTQAINQYQNK